MGLNYLGRIWREDMAANNNGSASTIKDGLLLRMEEFGIN